VPFKLDFVELLYIDFFALNMGMHNAEKYRIDQRFLILRYEKISLIYLIRRF